MYIFRHFQFEMCKVCLIPFCTGLNDFGALAFAILLCVVCVCVWHLSRFSGDRAQFSNPKYRIILFKMIVNMNCMQMIPALWNNCFGCYMSECCCCWWFLQWAKPSDISCIAFSAHLKGIICTEFNVLQPFFFNFLFCLCFDKCCTFSYMCRRTIKLLPSE